MLFVSFLIVSK